MRLAWPEKVAAFLFVIEVIALLWLGATAQHTAPLGERLSAFGELAWTAFLFTIAPAWAILRALDWLFGGPEKRRGVFTVRPLD